MCTYTKKDAKLYAKEQGKEESNGPEEKVSFIHPPQESSFIIIHLK